MTPSRARRRTARGTALTVYTPRAMAPALLEAITVGRARELSAIIDALRAAATSDARSHILVIGPRGSGKSHLLTLAANRARREPDLAERLRVVQLPEDDYSILGYRDLLVAALHELGDDIDPSTEPDVLEAALLSVLGDHVLVLFVENTNVVMDRLGEDGQRRLRAFLHDHQKLVLVASTPALFAAVADHDKPLYGSFQPIHLTELSPDEGRELLLQVARHDGDDDLGRFIAGETGRARLQVVSDLAGGSPRLWLLLAGCMTVELLDELVPLFVTLLDELSPYYKARLDELAPVQAKIVTTMARGSTPSAAGGAMTVAEIAAAAGMTPQTASKQLRELESTGFVRAQKLPGRDQRHTYYDLREPLLRHALEIKRTHGEPLEVIVTLLKSWHDPYVLRRAMLTRHSRATEDYLAHALAPRRPTSTDALYASGSVDDLIIEARTALNVPARRSALPPAASVVALAVALRVTGATAEEAIDAATRIESPPPPLLEVLRAELAATPAPDDRERAAAALFDAVADRCADTAIDPDVRASLDLLAAGFQLAIGNAEATQARLARGELKGVDPLLRLASSAELAFAEAELGHPREALDLLREVLDERRIILGAEHPDTLTSRSNEATVLGDLGEHEQALDILAALVEDIHLVLGPDHPDTLSVRHDLAFELGRVDEDSAHDRFAQLVSDRTRVLGYDHIDTLSSRHAHAFHVARTGDHPTAADLYSALIDDRRRVLGPLHRSTLISRYNHAMEVGEGGDHVTARRLFQELVDDFSSALGRDHTDTLDARREVAAETSELGDHATARDLYASLFRDRSRIVGTGHPDAIASRMDLGFAMIETHDRTGIEHVIAALEQSVVDDHPDSTSDSLRDLAAIVQDHGWRLDPTETARAVRVLADAWVADGAQVLADILLTGAWDAIRAELSGIPDDHLVQIIIGVLDAAEAVSSGDEGAMSRIGPELRPMVRNLVDSR